jgi:DNA-binding transcriptional ArsR family regulator
MRAESAWQENLVLRAWSHRFRAGLREARLAFGETRTGYRELVADSRRALGDSRARLARLATCIPPIQPLVPVEPLEAAPRLDSVRDEIFALLRGGPRAAGEIARTLGYRMPKVSHHLRALLDKGAVTCEARGRFRIYHLVEETPAPPKEPVTFRAARVATLGPAAEACPSIEAATPASLLAEAWRAGWSPAEVDTLRCAVAGLAASSSVEVRVVAGGAAFRVKRPSA